MSDGLRFELDCADARIRKLETELTAAQQKIAELEAERDQLIEQLAIRSETGMAKDMQEIMRINNELNETLTAERQQRENAEAVARPLAQGWRSYGNTEEGKLNLLRGTLGIWHFEDADKHFTRYPTASDSEERGG